MNFKLTALCSVIAALAGPGASPHMYLVRSALGAGRERAAYGA